MAMTDPQAEHRKGLILAVASYVTWGVLPIYIHLLHDVPALQVLAHRVLWSLLLLAIVVVALRRGPALRTAARGRTLGLLALSCLLIATNWLTYIWAVQHDHVLEASLGYFINPLVNVALGVAVLGERLRRMQAVAIAIAGLGVLAMAVSGGGALWVSLVLALSFGFYALVRKIAAIDALGGLTIETLFLAPVSLGWLIYSAMHGQSAFGQSTRIDLLLMLAGVVTSVPLLLFAGAAKRLSLAVVGLLQYIAPTLQFFQAVLVFHEPVRPVHMLTFALIWGGCALYAADSLRAMRLQRIAAAA